jgi:hypothetical protein
MRPLIDLIVCRTEAVFARLYPRLTRASWLARSCPSSRRYPIETAQYAEKAYLKSGAWSGKGSMRQAGEGVKDGDNALGDARRGIAALEHEGERGTDTLDDRACHGVQILRFEQQSAKRVTGETVEAGGNDGELRLEFGERRSERVVERTERVGGRRAVPERHVTRGTATGADAALVGPAGAGVVAAEVE